MKDQENYPDLLKVPDHAIIKELRTELGKANAYIAELEDTIKEKDLKIKNQSENIKGYKNKDDKRKEEIYSLNNQVFTLKDRISRITQG